MCFCKVPGTIINAGDWVSVADIVWGGANNKHINKQINQIVMCKVKIISDIVETDWNPKEWDGPSEEVILT